MVLKVAHCGPDTGSGDESSAEYSGESCFGAYFNSNGATQELSGTLHFVVSDWERGRSITPRPRNAGVVTKPEHRPLASAQGSGGVVRNSVTSVSSSPAARSDTAQ
jgi:hypothetical protein